MGYWGLFEHYGWRSLLHLRRVILLHYYLSIRNTFEVLIQF